MKRLRIYRNMFIITCSLLILNSCSSNTTKADEQEVKAMDSVSTDLDKSTRDLDEQAKKVEASLEKIDKEFETAK